MFGKSRKTEKERKEKEYGEKDGEKKVEKKDKKGERERRLSGNMRKISVWIRTRPVSYTHLDVYKRQLSVRLL